MKILYDDIIFYLQKHGGVSRYFSEIIERLSEFDGVITDVLRTSKFFTRRFLMLNSIPVALKLATDKHEIYHPTYYSESVKRRRG
ncbi:MAG: hypothetical protein ACYSSI_07840, partial [Planctomycetota bacterium]